MKAEQLQEGVLCLLELGRWDARVKMNKELFPKGLPEEITRVRQDMVLDRTLLDDLATIRRQAKGLLERNTMPFPIPGVRWVDKDTVNMLDESFADMKELYEFRIEALITEVSQMRKEFKQKYPKHYKYIKDKYPTTKQLRHKFYFRWQFFQINVPDKSTKILSPKVYKRETEKLRGMVHQMEDMAVNMIGNMLMKRVQTLAKQCDSGKVNAGTVGSFERFFKRWDDLWKDNVDQRKLRMIMSRLRKEMKGMDAEGLREDDSVRTQLSNTLEATIGKIKAIPNFQLKPKLDI
jgi:hypothetical protein